VKYFPAIAHVGVIANRWCALIVILTLLFLTLLTLSFFLLVLNPLMLLLLSSLVGGFTVSQFWTAFFVSIFIAVLSLVIGAFQIGGAKLRRSPPTGPWR